MLIEKFETKKSLKRENSEEKIDEENLDARKVRRKFSTKKNESLFFRNKVKSFGI